MEYAPYFIVALVVFCVGFAIWEGSQGATGSSPLLPIGIVTAIAGLGGAAAAYYMDVTVDDDVVNLDAVGIRTICFVGASATFVAGIVLAAAGHVIDTLRPRTPSDDGADDALSEVA